jgi:hypothetical protein
MHNHFVNFSQDQGPPFYGVKLQGIVLVVCSYCKQNQNVTSNSLPPNAIVIGREQLERLYTPSLSSRLQFLCDFAYDSVASEGGAKVDGGNSRGDEEEGEEGVGEGMNTNNSK